MSQGVNICVYIYVFDHEELIGTIMLMFGVDLISIIPIWPPKWPQTYKIRNVGIKNQTNGGKCMHLSLSACVGSLILPLPSPGRGTKCNTTR